MNLDLLPMGLSQSALDSLPGLVYGGSHAKRQTNTWSDWQRLGQAILHSVKLFSVGLLGFFGICASRGLSRAPIALTCAPVAGHSLCFGVAHE